MLTDLSRARLAGAWCAALIVIGSLSVAAGAGDTTSAMQLWLVTCLVPPSIMLAVWRGTPSRTIAEVLDAVNRPPV